MMMTNEEFWKQLDEITKKPQTLETTRALLSLLSLGYEEGNKILIWGVEDFYGKDTVNQACMLDEKGRKTMLYLTDKRHAVNAKFSFMPLMVHQPKCVTAFLCDVIDNALDKDEVDAIVFNYNTDQMYIVPIEILALHFMGNRFIPS